MRPRGRVVVLAAVVVSSSALLHCVGDEPKTGIVGEDEDGSISGNGDGAVGGDGAASSEAGGPSDGGTGDVDACTTSPCIIEVSAGGAHTCTRATDGVVRCWGANHFGELGSGSVFPSGSSADPTVVPNMSAKPLIVPGLSEVTALGTGGSYTATGMSCANLKSGKIQCWGVNSVGNLGRGGSGTTAITPKPALPVPADVTTITNAVSLGAGVQNACAVLQGGAVACWGSYDLGALNQTMASGSWTGSPFIITLAAGATAKKVAIAGEHVCVLTDGGGVQCWGENSGGANGPPSGPTVPVSVINLPEAAIDIDVGREFSCAVGASGAAYCWGEAGHLGRNPTETVSDPMAALVALPTGAKAVQIASGSYNSCILSDAGEVYCWGTRAKDCGPGTLYPLPGGTQLPTKVTGFPAKPVHLEGGHCHMCALLEGGGVACWGDNPNGELGQTPLADGGPNLVPTLVQF